MRRTGTPFHQPIRWASLALVAAFAALPPASASDPAGWAFMYERDGFKAYELRGSPPSYRAEGEVDVDLGDVAAVLVDIPREKEWVSHLSESRLLEGDPLGRSIVYSRYDLPWPVKDRDAVIESVVSERPRMGQVEVRFRTAASRLAPEGHECVRVPLCDGEFTLTEVARDRVRVVYTVRLDPGGWLPGWLVRHFVRDAPADTLRRFRAQVLRTHGQYDGFIRTQRERWEREKAREQTP